MKAKPRLNLLARLSGLGLLALCAAVQAQPRSFDIAGGDLKTALDAYAAQSGAQLIYRIEDVKGRSSKGLKRTLPADEALLLLLAGTPLSVRRDVSGAVAIFVETPPTPAKKQAEPEKPDKPDKRLDEARGAQLPAANFHPELIHPRSIP